MAIVMTLFLVAQPAVAQKKQANPDLKKEIELLKQGQIKIGKDIQEIKDLLMGKRKQRPPQEPFKEAIIDITGAPIKGDKNAKLIFVEFTDYQCPFCQRYFLNTQSQITKNYIETGKIRQVFMDYPLQRIHPYAQKAAEAGLCAHDQGKFWEMSDKMFTNPNKDKKWLAPENLPKIAEGVGLDVAAFQSCLDSGKHANDIKKRMIEGAKAKMTGAPAFYLGYVLPDGKVKVTKQIKGARPYDFFKKEIDEMLSPQK
jgi:protein-disulfide isomerase